MTRIDTTADVLASHHSGPSSGVFTDGSSSGNPGPGGWGAVYVRDGEIVEQRYGADPQTTNNRMELRAMIEGLSMAPPGEAVEVYSDSQLVVNTITQWAAGWKKRGWRRKQGAVANLELVQRAYALANERPQARIRWIRAHDGARWNEYADALATAYLRDEL
ncbi:MAG: ribonuclease H [Dehalococcoidia bacterium]